MAAYDIHGAFERVPLLLGMDALVKRGDHWEGGYYINGDRHGTRHDKLKVVKWKNDIWLHEEGGDSMPITKWLQQFGGASDYWDAVRILRGQSTPITYDAKAVRERKPTVVQYVSEDVLNGARQYDLTKCPLFTWMSGLFGADKVRDVWQKYNVTTDAHGNAVFWFVDEKGHILHDKRMAYNPDGHRNRDFGAWRKYTMSRGYTGKCLFGARLFRDCDRVYAVESEKTALLFNLYYDKPCVATGGKNALETAFGDTERLTLLPDMDAAAEWAKKGHCWHWWEHFRNVGDHWDIGDAIVERVKSLQVIDNQQVAK